MMEPIVHVVHCVDTEGPLYESLESKFERLEKIFGLRLKPTEANLAALLDGALDLGPRGDLIRRAASTHLLNTYGDWSALDAMLDGAMDEGFRLKQPDSFGGGYVYSWFCLDHVGYDVNPRRRAMGYHAVFDHYRELLQRAGETRDGLHWHFHPMSTYREAHRCATSLVNSPHVYETLARRVIERGWFPSSYRAGFHTERPDIHLFLEQYVPFDFSNTSVEDSADLEAQADFAEGRFGDWRLAPNDWGVYHPSHDNYQVPGQCRRLIARALNVLNRFAELTPRETEKAFAQAQAGRPTLLAVGSHDFRDLRAEADHLRALLADARRKFPTVKYKFCDAREAMRAVAYGGKLGEPLELRLDVHRGADGKPAHATIETARGHVFGPQPFFAVKTRSGRFIHDNLDVRRDLRSWRYVFDADSILPSDVEAVGIGAADKFGHTSVRVVWLDERRSPEQAPVPAGAAR